MTPGVLTRIRWRFTRPRVATRPAPRARRRSARTAIVAGFLAFLAATLGMTAAVESFRPQWRDPEFGHRLARLREREREATGGRPLLIAIGTSRTQNAIWPAAMGFPDEPGSPRVFNFGQSGATPLGELLTVLRIRDAGVRPTAITVEMLPIRLVVMGSAEDQFRGKAMRLSAADLRHLEPFSRDPDSLRKQWREARVVPWHAHRSLLLSHWLPRWVPWSERIDFQWDSMDADGFTPFPYDQLGSLTRDKAVAHARNEYGPWFNTFRPAEASVQALRELVAVCRVDGIAVAFVVPPVSPMFRGWFNPKVWASADAHLRALAAELGVPVFPAPELPESDFADGHHLLRVGARKYSRWLADTHLKPWLRVHGGTP